MDLCKRIDLLLKRVEGVPDSFYEFAPENEEIIKYAFLARAVVRELIDPRPELFKSIAAIESEFAEYANQIDISEDEDYEEENFEDEDNE